MSGPTDWIEWAGGECPVAPETLVELKLDHPSPWDDGGWAEPASDFDWQHQGEGDIIAYRVVQL